MAMRSDEGWIDGEAKRVGFMTRGEFAALIRNIQRDALQSAAQQARYYLKHQDLPRWEDMSATEKGTHVACENIEKTIRALVPTEKREQAPQPGGGDSADEILDEIAKITAEHPGKSPVEIQAEAAPSGPDDPIIFSGKTSAGANVVVRSGHCLTEPHVTVGGLKRACDRVVLDSDGTRRWAIVHFPNEPALLAFEDGVWGRRRMEVVEADDEPAKIHGSARGGGKTAALLQWMADGREKSAYSRWAAKPTFDIEKITVITEDPQAFLGGLETLTPPRANQTPGIVGEVERCEEKAAARTRPRTQGPRVPKKAEADCDCGSKDNLHYNFCKTKEDRNGS